MSCNASKFIPEQKYLLESVKVESDNRELDPTMLQAYIRQKANSKWFSIFKIPLGTYSFSNNSTTEKIEFRKYVGLPKSFSTSIIIPSDWILYETQGSFTIVEKTIINGFQVVKIKLNFTASQNGIVEYTINNADFITAY